MMWKKQLANIVAGVSTVGVLFLVHGFVSRPSGLLNMLRSFEPVSAYVVLVLMVWGMGAVSYFVNKEIRIIYGVEGGGEQ